MRRTAERSAAIDRTPDPELVERFRSAIERADLADARLGVAVSGGPDSVALLLLAQAAFPGRIEAATVDHGLRPESADEARFVAGLCAELGVPHETLMVAVGAGNLQDEARKARYSALGEWQQRRGLGAVMTAHHADDQAETLLMRLNRGSGLGGLAGVRSFSANPQDPAQLVLRPLLEWRKAELEQLVAHCGVAPVRDPSNEDERFDRARMRMALAESDWLDVDAIARSAGLLEEAEAALAQWADEVWHASATINEAELRVTVASSLPREIKRRVLERAIRHMGGQPRGAQVVQLLDALEAGQGGNLAGVLATSENGAWKLRREPPRR